MLLTLSAVTAFLLAQEVPARMDLNDMAWMVGCWEGEGFGSPVRECWMQGPDGRMTGMFDMLDAQTGAQQFSEIFVIDTFETGPEMRLRHFNPDMTGWEAQDEWVTFTLLETGEGLARFEGLTYRLTEEGSMTAELDVTTADGVRTETLVFERVR